MLSYCKSIKGDCKYESHVSRVWSRQRYSCFSISGISTVVACLESEHAPLEKSKAPRQKRTFSLGETKNKLRYHFENIALTRKKKTKRE